MMRFLFTSLLVISVVVANAQKKDAPAYQLDKISPESTELYKEVPLVTPSPNHQSPSDGLVLFDGSGTSQWQKNPIQIVASMREMDPIIRSLKDSYQMDPVEWRVEKGEMVVKPGSGAIATKKSFGDVQLHLEWNAPVDEGKSSQLYSNSGVFFMGLYEVQILNSYENPTYSNGQASSVYKQHIPLVNASRPPGEWQVYDIIFTAPRFSEKGTMISPARVTVFHNGILTQNNVELLGPTCYIGTPYYVPHPKKLPLILQDHGDPVRFRNIWIREL